MTFQYFACGWILCGWILCSCCRKVVYFFIIPRIPAARPRILIIPFWRKEKTQDVMAYLIRAFQHMKYETFPESLEQKLRQGFGSVRDESLSDLTLEEKRSLINAHAQDAGLVMETIGQIQVRLRQKEIRKSLQN